MSAAEINDIIARTDERIKLMIDVGSVNVLILEDISSLWSGIRVFLKDPNARSLAEYSERRDVTLKMMKDELNELLKLSGGGVSLLARMEPL